MVVTRLKNAPRWAANKWGKLVTRLAPYSPMGQGKDIQEELYGSDEWGYLKSLDESARFGVVWSFCRRLAPGGSILEIGCGDGLLHDFLSPDLYSHFTGVDISETAIERTRPLWSAKTEFIAADAETFTPARRYDLIVFNEVLEYFTDPLALVKRYEPFANEGAHFVVSMFAGLDTSRTRHIWRMLGSRYQQVGQARVSTQPDYWWNIKAFPAKPKA